MNFFKKYSSRGLSIIVLFLLSYIASHNDEIDTIEFESSMRWVAFSVSLLSIPWYNGKIYGITPVESSGWEKLYRIALLPIPVLFFLISRSNISVALQLSLAIFIFTLRNKIIDRSLAKGITMSYLQMYLFFGLPVVTYILFFLPPRVDLLLVVLFATFLLDKKALLSSNTVDLAFHLPKRISKGILIPTLSILTLVAGNIDLLIIDLIKEKDPNIALTILYVKRLVLVVELLVLTLIQTSSLEDVRKGAKKLVFIGTLLSVVIFVFFPHYLSLFGIKEYSVWFVVLFIGLNVFRSLSILVERDLIEDPLLLRYYVVSNALLVFAFSLSLFLVDKLQDILIILLLFVLGQSVLRLVISNTHRLCKIF